MDDDLRALERELAASGALEARLRLAAALSRAGRGDDAARALLPASAEPAVQRELSRWPSWGTPHGVTGRAGTPGPCRSGPACAGRGSCGRPRARASSWPRRGRSCGPGALELRRRDGAVVWRRAAERGPTARSCGPRLVVEGRSEGRRRSLHLLDRGTGEERARLDDGAWGPGYLLQVGDAILHWPALGLLRACDHEGRERWRLQLPAHAVPGSGPAAVTPGRLLVASADHLVCVDEGP